MKFAEFVPKVPRVLPDESSDFVNGFTSRRFYIGEISGIEYLYGLRDQSGMCLCVSKCTSHQPCS